MQIQEILIIKNGAENYGISTEDINQISRVPSLMPLPLRPYGTRGLCALAGSIVSMVDLNLLLDAPAVDLEDDKIRLLSLNAHHSSNALLVSEVYNTVDVDESKIEYLDTEDDVVVAIYKFEDSLIQILSLDALFSKINKVEIASKEVSNGKTKLVNTKEEDSTRFLIFSMNNEKFALNIDFLREIILADTEYTDIIGSSKELLGLITLRDELISVMYLRTYYGFEDKRDDKNRILVACYNNGAIGLLVDEIIDIKNVFNKDIEYMRDEFSKSKISGVIHDDGTLISLLDKEVIEVIFEDNSAYIDTNDDEVAKGQGTDVVSEVIVFKLADKEYAFDVDVVAEIIDIVSTTNVVYTDDSVEGVINIRGQIVPIVSLFQKLGIKDTINEDSKIIICSINGNKVGFVVDSISDIINVRAGEFREQDDELFTHVLYLDDGERLVLSMDIEKIISVKEE
jgi:purine-binding chemotaxis protein CheW